MIPALRGVIILLEKLLTGAVALGQRAAGTVLESLPILWFVPLVFGCRLGPLLLSSGCLRRSRKIDDTFQPQVRSKYRLNRFVSILLFDSLF